MLSSHLTAQLTTDIMFLNLIYSTVPFLRNLKTSKNQTFSGIKKGNFGVKWVKQHIYSFLATVASPATYLRPTSNTVIEVNFTEITIKISRKRRQKNSFQLLPKS